MNIHVEFSEFLKKEKLTLTTEQQAAATLFLQFHDQNPIWLRARRSGVTTLFNALEKFYKYHEPLSQGVIVTKWAFNPEYLGKWKLRDKPARKRRKK